MSLNLDHIVALAKISLSPKEKQKFSAQLGDVLEYFKKLSKLDTKNVAAFSISADLANIYRSDEVKDCSADTQKQILANAPEASGQYIKTDKIL